MTALREHHRVTPDNVQTFFDWVFAPWVKAMGLRDLQVGEGAASAVLPQTKDCQWANGAVCGQTIMAAIDTVTTLAMATTDRAPRGTSYQHTHFLRPAANGDMLVEAKVLRFGKTSAFAECRVSFTASGDLVAHASLEFAF
jgi:uncharacterized protein (TIGR00369 family)